MNFTYGGSDVASTFFPVLFITAAAKLYSGARKGLSYANALQTNDSLPSPLSKSASGLPSLRTSSIHFNTQLIRFPEMPMRAKGRSNQYPIHWNWISPLDLFPLDGYFESGQQGKHD